MDGGWFDTQYGSEEPPFVAQIGEISSFTRGLKAYEISNHLGNVLVTVSDKKFGYGVDNAGVLTMDPTDENSYFQPEILSAQDYYAYGATKPGRRGSLKKNAEGNIAFVFDEAADVDNWRPIYDYRYAFNGKEADKKIWSEERVSYDYGFRILDGPQFTSPDPHAEEYPSISPYAYCFNNPIAYVDEDGRDGVLIVFSNYKVGTGIKLGKFDLKMSDFGKYPGHAGVLLINNKTGATKYYEYGRYPTGDDTEGKVRTRTTDRVVIRNGKPTKKSLKLVLSQISQKSGQKGRIDGIYFRSDKFNEMKEYAEEKLNESNYKHKDYNPGREQYDLTDNNCGTFAVDVLTRDPKINKVVASEPVDIEAEYDALGYPTVTYAKGKDGNISITIENEHKYVSQGPASEKKSASKGKAPKKNDGGVGTFKKNPKTR